ncbi:FAD-binding and (Fe-S)-binding domain-containing protein [Buchananella hordeovulneris]|uniref:FAD-binding oxidoreductase n=1 Tax=Buchananella hordeovulneris TaxID=52770 RepID=A0A1Q5PZ28_9ACTO|nr:FAD-binding and (Fe-S)-binding domain-containing protein [Buchananella hordeovulneris]OKL52620.1 FAD-binding oxidoreductase [Buchananella hordeovulneris]
MTDSSERARALAEALRRELGGEVDVTARRRAEYATDASNYRVVPQLVAFPRDADDVEAATALARHHEVPVTNRGAGTSCAGNAIGPGLVLDFSRHMHRVVSVDAQAREAVVEPGCVMADLQQAAAVHGLRFGPDPSTWTRATLGGMIGNNACGPHAVAYGRTADNVLSLEAITGDGRRLHAAAGRENLAQVPGLTELVDAHLAPIRTGFGLFGRQVSGYSLEHLLPENGSHLARFLTGSEGTLATWTAARLRLVPQAAAPVLVVLGYQDMIAAADAVPALLAHRPLAVEGLDARLVEVVRRHKGAGAVPALPAGQGWLMVEVAAADAADAEPKAALAAAMARAEALVRDAGAIEARVYPPGSQATALWRIRADGAGLGGRTPAGDPAWPGWEDAAVPPAHLGAYLRDFTALLRRCGVDGLLYGHFGDGCLHVRLDLPLGRSDGRQRMRDFLTEAAQLVAQHGGSLSGEHGDGRARSELLPLMYSPTELALFRGVKHLFDPAGCLNPGVLVDPDPVDASLRLQAARPVVALAGRGAGFAFRHDDGDITKAVHRCTGVGKCRASTRTVGGFMCPSYQATRDEKDVTRGRARVLQEATTGQLVGGLAAPELRESLDLCLACKACSADCPTGMDVARLRSEVLHRSYQGKLRPRVHYVLGWLPRWLALVARVPGAAQLVNFAMALGPVRRLGFRLVGVDRRRLMPSVARESLARWAKRARLPRGLPSAGNDDTPAGTGEKKRYVVLWADSFSHYLSTAAARALYRVLRDAGYTVLLPETEACCGLTWITTGQLTGARKKLTHLLSVLAPFAKNGIPIVGVEPSCTAVLRDDLPDLLPTDPRAQLVADGTYTLAELLTAPAPLGPGPQWQPPDLTGVQVVAQPHCHHHSVMGWQADAALLARAGAQVTQLQGCCGLAGNYGMEQGHYDVSVAVANNSLLPALAAAPDAIYLADGFSCRTQAEQLAARSGLHLAQLLAGEATATT